MVSPGLKFQPRSMEHFISARAFDITFQTESGLHDLLVELRKLSDGTSALFTKIDEQEVRVSSLQELLLAQTTWLALRVSHAIGVLWDGKPRQATLWETFTPSSDRVRLFIQLLLRFNNQDGSYETYETATCSTLQDARFELREVISEDHSIWVMACCDCIHSWPALVGPGWDEHEELSCYRDEGEAEAELREKGKFASIRALEAGQYFVHAFHRCAAWRPMESGD